MKNLRELVLYKNHIKKLEGIENLSKLGLLDLAENPDKKLQKLLSSLREGNLAENAVKYCNQQKEISS